MRNNKAILDEAARSIRRTFIGSVAGSVGMLAVVGAAGAYGMPERLTAQAFAAAIAKLNLTFPHAAEFAKSTDRAAKVASANDAPAAAFHAISPVRELPQAATDEPVVKTLPSAPPPALIVQPAAAESVPAVTSNVARALPEPEPRGAVSITTMFEEPKLSDIKPLEAMPTIEIAVPQEPKPSVAAAPQDTTSGNAALTMLTPAETMSVPAAPQAEPFPQLATLPMPPAKPPLTPAQRLELTGKDYDKAQLCLAQAIYFEARNEPARGQMAVAQVVLNRVFSPHYPKDVCSVVYQNASRHLSCQFTFACDGKPESISEHGAWLRANRIAKEALDAKIWLPEVNKATHYHAAYVRPNWIRDMRVMVRYGLHTFYRPRNWGDGSNEPAWGSGARKFVKS
jgi:hypothetical protein